MPVLFFAHDAGLANQLVAANDLLIGHHDDLPFEAKSFVKTVLPDLPALIFACGPALKTWHEAGIAVKKLGEVCPSPNSEQRRAEIENLFKRERISRIVTGAGDMYDHSERMMWQVAHAQKIPSHCLLDRRLNLASRFRLDDKPVYPDWIHVPAATYIEPLVKAGVPADRIQIIGTIHYWRLKHNLPSASSRMKTREEWRVSDEDFVFLFASESISESPRYKSQPAPYNEFYELEKLIRLIDSGEGVDGMKTSPERSIIVIKPHPKDIRGKYGAYCENRSKLFVSDAGTPLEAIFAANMVVGMGSSMLVDAKALGLRTFSLTNSDIEV